MWGWLLGWAGLGLGLGLGLGAGAGAVGLGAGGCGRVWGWLGRLGRARLAGLRDLGWE